jgi:predicted SnoaL-like aldol condensation-catalyzing enzyme
MTTPQDHKALVLKAFDTLFNRRDYAAAAAFWSPTYIQHGAHIDPGPDGLFNLIQAAPPDLRYENALAVADGDYALLHGRFSNNGQPRPRIVVDIVRLENGQWDVIQDEVGRASSTSGLPMFGEHFPG